MIKYKTFSKKYDAIATSWSWISGFNITVPSGYSILGIIAFDTGSSAIMAGKVNPYNGGAMNYYNAGTAVNVSASITVAFIQSELISSLS